MVSSCSVLKKTKTTTTKQIEKTEIKQDSTSKETINKAIDNKLTIKIEESVTGDRDFGNPSVTTVWEPRVEGIELKQTTEKSIGG